MQDLATELDAWLGDDWTAEQVATITERVEAWEQAHPEADEDTREAAWASIAQQVDGLLDLTVLAAEHTRARLVADDARCALRAGVWAAVTYGDMSESEAARVAAVDRMTVRSWLGKR